MEDFDQDPQEQEIARAYKWEGVELQPFSFGRHAAFQRCGVIGGSTMESAVVLVKLCMMSPVEVSAIRGDAVAPFLALCSDWADAQGIGLGTSRKAKTEAIVKIYNDILNELYEAESVAPMPDNGTPTAGNA